MDGQISESDYDVASTVHNPGESTLFLPADSVFWLPYALSKFYTAYNVYFGKLTTWNSLGVSIPNL